MHTAREQARGVPSRKPVDRPKVAEALAEIARDVRKDTEDYLKYTRSPGGGE